MANVLLLFGVAKRDDRELVAMFFDNRQDLEEFRESLPGRYQIIEISGIESWRQISETIVDDDDDCWNDLEVFVPDDDDYEWGVS
jgi:hypothetical protein